MTKFDAIVIGDESLARECAQQMLDRGHGIAAFVSGNAALRDWAAARGLQVMSGVDALGDLTCDWLFSIANLRLLGAEVLGRARQGAVNFHDGPLPRYAGLNAPVWALLNGETRHGITWHLIGDGVDQGDILVRREFDIAAQETAQSLNTRCYAEAIESFGAVLDQVARGAPDRRVQDMGLRSYFARDRRPEAAGVLRFDQTAEDVARVVRALDHGNYRNPLCVARLRIGDSYHAVGRADVVPGNGAPGEILDVAEGVIRVACGLGAVALSGLRRIDGGAVAPVAVGDRLPVLSDAEAEALQAQAEALAPAEAAWRDRLRDWQPVKLPGGETGLLGTAEVAVDWPESLSMADRAEVIARWAAQAAGMKTGDVALQRDGDGIAAGWVPFRSGEDLERGAGFAADLILRDPELAGMTMPEVALGDVPVTGARVTISLTGAMHFDAARMPEAMALILAARLAHMAAAMANGEDGSEMPRAERNLVLHGWNRTVMDYDRTATIQSLFEAQVAATPDAVALVVGAETLTYSELNARANRVAHALRAFGVGAGTLVGLCTERNPSLVIGALAIHKAGGAYVPMDPAYPAERLRLFLDDSGAKVVLSETALGDIIPEGAAEVICLDDAASFDAAPEDNPEAVAGPGDLAYLIYTSGTTGRPKGVMVEHRNVVNFFAGMDARIGREDPGCWLALTSLSFDISVMELFYSLARGYKLVLVNDEDKLETAKARDTDGMQFSLFYWGNDDGVGRDKYKTLLEGAKFADRNGFCAVWTPERHFHAFGGPYPNPSVTGAAVAAVTQKLAVRAGSCVAPLHHTARIAEEWAVIDNLTNGRSGLAIASGWQPDDFVLRPENTPPENKPAMLRQIDELRRLWSGEAVEYAKADGTKHAVVTQPRPVSKELTIWVTTAGNPATWEEAGRIGANVLTHLLGQSVDEVAQKIGIYHAALRAAGHDPAKYTVTLMLHSFVAETREKARDVARGPMKDYLRSAAGLIKQYAWAFPAFKRPEGARNAFDLSLEGLSNEEMDAILDFAFQRYLEDSGLFGTVEDCLARIDDLKAIGVGEVACLIDYGIDAETVLDGLRPLAEVVAACNAGVETDFSIAAQIERHAVTHLQCTPSMARVLLMSPETRRALGQVESLMLGGEPLAGALVDEMRGMTEARIETMYGPTETTIWSSTGPADGGAAICDIGTPIANTQMYVLNDSAAPAPVGVTGELFIAGDGVTRGYWQRHDLTEERFVENPFGGGRMYRTGDLARWRADGRIEFIGRADTQVKLRGHRIELGEIEARLEAVDGVRQAVVVVQDGQTLAAFFDGQAEAETLRAGLLGQVPGYMVPQRFEKISEFPLTPNRKVDRKALVERKTSVPAPKLVDSVAVAAGEDLQPRIAAIWSRVLGVADIPPQGNFFDLGGHSLLAVQAHRDMRSELGLTRLSIADVFGYPTLAGLTSRIAEIGGPKASARRAQAPSVKVAVDAREAPVSDNSMAAARLDAMARRQQMRARRKAG